MKAVWFGLSIAALIGIAGWYGATEFLGSTSADSYASPNGTVRLDDGG